MNLDLPHFKAEVHTEPWPKVHREPWQRCRGSPRTSGHIDFFLIFQGKMTIFWPLITLYIITVKYLIYIGSPTAPLFRPYGLYKHEI